MRCSGPGAILGRLLLVLMLGLGMTAAHAQDGMSPIRSVAPTRLLVIGPAGGGSLPIFVDPDWTQPHAGITRAVVMVHGPTREWGPTAQLARRLRAAAGEQGDATVLVVPQFLTPGDLLANNLPTSLLRWRGADWVSGRVAHGPALLSSFHALDAILDRLASVRMFPNLKTVVIAGHDAGADMVQRYAAAGSGPSTLAARDIHVRLVVANSNSYLYFQPERPARTDAAACPNVDTWPYGMEGAPPYVAAPDKLAAQYISRDVVQLLGAEDNAPESPGLDGSCAAMAQGPNRLTRGVSQEAVLRRKHGADLRQRVVQLPGIGHDASAVFASPCGMATLFDTAGCEALSK